MVDKKSSRINRHDTSPLINCESMTALQRLSHVYFVQFSIAKQQRGFRTNRKITFFMHTIPAQFFMTSSSNIQHAHSRTVVRVSRRIKVMHV